MMVLCIGALVFAGLICLQKKGFLGIVFGLILLSNAINLSIFLGSGPKVGLPPFLRSDGSAPPSNDPLPQALVLTAIVIGFALLGFLVTLVKKLSIVVGNFASETMKEEENAE